MEHSDTMSTLNLKEPDQVNWDAYESGSTYQAPPPVLGPDLKPIKYTGLIPQLTEAAFEATDEGYRQYILDPIVIARSGAGADGYKIRWTRVNTKKFISKKTGKPVEASSVGNLLRSAGVQAKPQKNAEYDGAMKAIQGKPVQFTIDWEARNKDTGEKVRGYESFPEDPDRPGQRKAILRAGDQYKGEDGTMQTVKAEVLFANARVRYFVDGSRK